jgi:hypothetical protein
LDRRASPGSALSVVCSNRSYFNDEEHQERVALERNCPVENKIIGIPYRNLNVDFGAVARTYGCWAPDRSPSLKIS